MTLSPDDYERIYYAAEHEAKLVKNPTGGRDRVFNQIYDRMVADELKKRRDKMLEGAA